MQHAPAAAHACRATQATRASSSRMTPVALAIMSILRAVGAHSADTTGAAAESANDTAALEEVTVTATKRSEDQQRVPIAIEALSSKTLTDMNVQNFNDYATQLSSVNFQQTDPGRTNITMRGISSDSGGNPSGSLPTVGMYLDEQPITTIQGPIDVHMYDIARVEVLPGPQGTLYGASSESGTIRVITNKPDATRFAAGYDIQGNTVKNGTFGAIAEGFVNLPITDHVAARLVGWYERDSGYIDNVFGTANVLGHTFNNANVAADHFNPVDVYGARAALKVDLGDNWTVTPMVMAQTTRREGIFAQQDWKDLSIAPAVPDELAVRRYTPDRSRENWIDSALTVQGKIGNFDVTYSGAFLKRDDHRRNDYADYEFYYQQYASYWPADTGWTNSAATWYQQFSNELRIASPQDLPVRFVGGVYQSRQLQNFYNGESTPENLRPQYEVGYPNPPGGNEAIVYLLDQQRVNRDKAAFGEVTWDITSKLSLLGGIRRFHYENSLEGFYGFGINAFATTPPPPLVPGGPPGPGGISGEQTCFTTTVWHGTAPCEDIRTSTSGSGWTPKVNLSYKFTDRVMAYATYSKGFRPGGVNRTAAAPPYTADFLKNYEVGWKTTWWDNRLRVNGAVYYEKWDNFQFNFIGQYAIPLIANAGNARVKGGDLQIEMAPTQALTLRLSGTYTDAYLAQNYCGALNPDGSPITSNPCIVSGKAPFAPLAQQGTRLPNTPRIKTSASARYLFPIGAWEGHAQADLVYQSWVSPALREKDFAVFGQQPAYALTNFFLGAQKDGLSVELLVKNVFDRRAVLNRYAACGVTTCGTVSTYDSISIPRLIGVQVGQKF
jgi:iron complex outermembrane recepter protein